MSADDHPINRALAIPRTCQIDVVEGELTLHLTACHGFDPANWSRINSAADLSRCLRPDAASLTVERCDSSWLQRWNLG
ncbi:hypothetical protein [Amycolatopsis sp. cmx-11-51]|uniref:hypothetical protein n=1 Tax=Amycolatopsis sp. cmx-11-51 TaxID=2785797 RepID=UPI0039E686EF